ncbi:NADP-dependent malic enzyme [Amphiplicatus metriothermophilus]|uniref:Allosteric NADP-dependent malic enzyme n=1 Tax=Amphiplicatus metriothermophilus TaxID=1519374 RepID=A0A239PLX9_9PROT|nr:NADP-dependent malic enzyme [Amphiplicatus metriothermophilus]MBB5517561.1 malate dehydrogenase (oxaloacetate-decarboxylating)(NADP+) [Amphiplicatus metriothermophilus]SNT68104.1 allosteric NADP-dependent malic enzyme [Amphiplicatus metriothermophilus]
MDDNSTKFTDEEALHFHSRGKPGKLEVNPTKPMATQRDLSLAYSPGVAVPVKAIAAEPDLAYDYTSKGNMVAVISNGTAILGLGDLGALAAKPVMEGKSVLFKRFADIDSVDIEVDTKDPEEFINCVRFLGPAFGGINLEDIAAPESFYIEQRLKELMDIPVFHDDQHGTAIIAAAGLLNALDIAGKSIRDIKVAVSGAGSSALSVIGLIKAMGLPHENALVCDSKGVLHKGRQLDQWRSAHAVETDKRTLAEVMDGADVFIGLSVGGAVTKEMVKSMAKNPIIFAMANPTPEILPEDVRATRDDAIIATGRSDYPNQVNNVLGFPYIFRGALDARARTINEEMKIACAEALARLAREDVPDEVAAAYGKRLKYGPGYIIPTPFDPRLISAVPPAVAKAAADSGVARKPVEDLKAYSQRLAARLDPSASFLQKIYATLRGAEIPKRIVFAEGEEESVIRAAYAFQQEGLGKAILIGREELVKQRLRELGLPTESAFEIHNARLSTHNPVYTDYLYERLQRKGYLYRDAQRLVNTDRNVFGACMLAHGHADGMVTGVTRNYDVALENVRLALDARPGERLIGVSIILAKGRTLFVADNTITQLPSSEDLAEIAVQVAHAARRMGSTPKVAFVSYSNFGSPDTEHSRRVAGAVQILDRRRDVDFQYEGEMTPRMALNETLREIYPFSRLTGEANVLITPGVHSAAISTKLLAEVGGATVIGPLLIGLERPVQITQIGARVPDIVTLAAVAAYDLDVEHRSWAQKTL